MFFLCVGYLLNRFSASRCSLMNSSRLRSKATIAFGFLSLQSTSVTVQARVYWPVMSTSTKQGSVLTISGLIERLNPDVASVEKVIYGKNANTMMVLGEARGAVIAAAAAAGIEIYEYEPRRAKMSVCGNGLASKEQVQRMTKTLLALDALPQNDAADALALAICHANARPFLAGKGNLV